MSSTKSADDISPSNSISLIKLDELSSFGATKQNRLPALIKLNTIDQNTQQVASISMPNFSESDLEKQAALKENHETKQYSLPVEAIKKTNMPEAIAENQQNPAEKENNMEAQATGAPVAQEESDDFQVVDMQHEDLSSDNVLIGPSLPHNPIQANKEKQQSMSKNQIDKSLNALQSSLQMGSSTHLGDSLIEMIINLRSENQDLIRALETNNEYVKDRLSEFKKIQEDSKKREAQFSVQKADLEHQIRKLQRQNSVLSERLKNMEVKLKDMKLEVSESLDAAHSSKASSIQNDQTGMYPSIGNESFANEALLLAERNGRNLNSNDPHQATTMQIDATEDELCQQNDEQNQDQQQSEVVERRPVDFSTMSKEELGKHFDAKKVEFYALNDDPMKQCDKLEQQLNDIGKRDYEICLLQQQLNIYRQDFRLERMEKLEAKIQIEKLKNDIDRLCLERLQETCDEEAATDDPTTSGRRISDGLGRFGHHLTKKAAKQAAKAAKYAAKQAHLEEKAAAALARVAAARAGHRSSAPSTVPSAPQQPHPSGQSVPTAEMPDQREQEHGQNQAYQHHQHGGRHHHHHRHHGSFGSRARAARSEVVNDLLSTANKAMLTGYKMASTHVNLALDKLSQYEQQQASQLEKSKQQAASSKSKAPSAPMQEPDVD